MHGQSLSTYYYKELYSMLTESFVLRKGGGREGLPATNDSVLLPMKHTYISTLHALKGASILILFQNKEIRDFKKKLEQNRREKKNRRNK